MPRIVSADARLLDWLEREAGSTSFSASVHSIFPHAVNMVWSARQPSQDDRLFFLVHGKGDNGPGALVTDARDFCSLPLAQGMAVRVGKGELRVGRTAIPFLGARKWEAPVLSFSKGPGSQGLVSQALISKALAEVSAQAARAEAEKERKALARLGALLNGFSASASASTSTSAGAGVRVRAGVRAGTGASFDLDRLLTSRTRAMVHALRAGDTEEALHCAAGLLGLGQGLTPSGDDILLGFLAACTVSVEDGRGPEAWQGRLAAFRQGVVDKAKKATHILSWAGIAEAAQGRMRTSLSSFIQAVLTGTEADRQRTLAGILAIGACSGADLAYGILVGLDLVCTENALAKA